MPAPADLPDTVVFASETRTAADAAAAIGSEIGAIVKSLVFRRREQTVLVLCSGATTVDAKRLDVARADPAHVRAISGFAIGACHPTAGSTRRTRRSSTRTARVR